MDPMLIPIAALSIPLIVAPTAIVAKSLQRSREMRHRERMYALELGRTLPGDESWWSTRRIGLVMGIVLPIVALMVGAAAGSDGMKDISILSGMVGLAGVISGAMLVAKSSTDAAPASPAAAKPQYDPEEFDVVGRRG